MQVVAGFVVVPLFPPLIISNRPTVLNMRVAMIQKPMIYD